MRADLEKTDLEFRDPSLFGPVVFRPGFNSFEKLNVTQAWSLFFTASKEDKALGFNPELGRFFNYTLIAIAVAVVSWSFIFKPFQ